MPDWRHAIERRLAPLRLAPTREAEVVEELAQHLDDRYEEMRPPAFRTTRHAATRSQNWTTQIWSAS